MNTLHFTRHLSDYQRRYRLDVVRLLAVAITSS
jgi:hypothetical protein